MNIQSVLSKIYNVIKYSQVQEPTSETFGKAAYMAGMLDSAKLFMKTYNGELTEKQVEYELEKLKAILNQESVN